MSRYVGVNHQNDEYLEFYADQVKHRNMSMKKSFHMINMQIKYIFDCILYFNRYQLEKKSNRSFYNDGGDDW